MATKREKLESRATELNLEFVSSTTDDELQQLIDDFSPENDPANFGSETKFFKCLTLPGLSVQIGDSPTGQQDQPQHVRFTPFEFFDEEKGDHYRVGYLATDEQDAIEVLADDPNVIEITQAEFLDDTTNAKRAKY